MRKLLILAVALTAFLLPVAVQAQFSLGARVGYAIAGGDAVKDGKMSDGFAGAIPFQLDAGFRVVPDLEVGAFFSYGFGRLGKDVKDECDAFDLDCSERVVRLGLQATYSLSTVSPSFVPWGGIGFGYEWASLKQSDGTDTLKTSFKGFELVNLQAGADFKLAPQMRVGPFLSFSLGRYSKATLDLNGTKDSADITDKGVHSYLTIGVRGQFNI